MIRCPHNRYPELGPCWQCRLNRLRAISKAHRDPLHIWAAREAVLRLENRFARFVGRFL